MKKSLLFAILAVFLLAGVSQADNFMLYSSGYENGSNVSVVINNASTETFAAYFKMGYGSVDYMGYCVDYAPVNWNTTYDNYAMINIPAFSANHPDPNTDRYRQAAWLFETYGTDPATSGKNVQLAIWETIFDQGDLNHSVSPSSGKFYVTDPSDLGTAQGYVNQALTHSDFNASNYRLLVSPKDGEHYGEGKQDFIVKTPEPGMLALLGIGLLGLFLAARRKVIS